LLYYHIAENLLRKLRSSGDKDKLESINKMIDDYYKLKLINKITSEKQEFIDALGEYFHKRYSFLFLFFLINLNGNNKIFFKFNLRNCFS